jgi:beta-lactamase class A
MKVPVLIELTRQVDAQKLRWSDSLPIRNRFSSIVDASDSTLEPASDGDSTVYAAIGRSWSLRQLATRMIVRSSNLATNLLLERVGAANVTATIRRLGAGSGFRRTSPGWYTPRCWRRGPGPEPRPACRP